jgi:hypothetical protein
VENIIFRFSSYGRWVGVSNRKEINIFYEGYENIFYECKTWPHPPQSRSENQLTSKDFQSPAKKMKIDILDKISS